LNIGGVSKGDIWENMIRNKIDKDNNNGTIIKIAFGKG
jgi:hypothetical protein